MVLTTDFLSFYTLQCPSSSHLLYTYRECIGHEIVFHVYVTNEWLHASLAFTCRALIQDIAPARLATSLSSFDNSVLLQLGFMGSKIMPRRNY